MATYSFNQYDLTSVLCSGKLDITLPDDASPDVGIVAESDFIGETIFDIPYVGYAVYYITAIPRSIVDAIR